MDNQPMNKGQVMSDWKPSKEDVELICDAIVSNWVAENPSNSADYCIHCHYEYGNVQKRFIDKGKKPPHHKDCPYPIAQDILTSID